MMKSACARDLPANDLLLNDDEVNYDTVACFRSRWCMCAALLYNCVPSSDHGCLVRLRLARIGIKYEVLRQRCASWYRSERHDESWRKHIGCTRQIRIRTWTILGPRRLRLHGVLVSMETVTISRARFPAYAEMSMPRFCRPGAMREL